MLIEVEDVWRLIDERAAPLPPTRVPLGEALGLTLAEAAMADDDQPPFDRATMDGYAIRDDDPAERFRVVATIAAGDSREVTLGPGEAVRIFTGAAVPAGELRVIMQEDAVREGDGVRFTERGGHPHVARRGEDVRAGATLIAAGTRLSAAGIAVMASIGQTHPLVGRPVRVLHFTTGDEVVPVEQSPGPGQIRNSNAALVGALLAEFPIASRRHVHLPDDEAAAMALIDAAGPDDGDLLLFSGGASVGDHDLTATFLRRMGFETHCAGVNVRPGKPLHFASRGSQLAFALPGNPVSHFACFHLFVARALARLTGLPALEMVAAELRAPIPGRPNRRVTFWPARLVRAGVDPMAWNGSGHLAALLGVNALIRIPAEAELPKPGASVQILSVEAVR